MSKRINPYKLFVGCFLPNWLVRRQEISQGAKICYARLAQYAGDKGYAYPSQETLAGELGVCSRQVRNYLDELVKARLIDSDQQGLNSTNCYYFLTHEWMGLDDEPIENKGPEEDFHSGPEVGPEVSFHSGPEISFRSVRKYPSGRTGNILPTEDNQLRDSYEERKEACEYIFRNEEPRQQDIDPNYGAHIKALVNGFLTGRMLNHPSSTQADTPAHRDIPAEGNIAAAAGPQEPTPQEPSCAGYPRAGQPARYCAKCRRSHCAIE